MVPLPRTGAVHEVSAGVVAMGTPTRPSALPIGKGFPVAGRLEQTGMGFDATVFMTRGTLTALAREAERILKHPLNRDGSLISTVMVKLAPGYDSVKAARALNGQLFFPAWTR